MFWLRTQVLICAHLPGTWRANLVLATSRHRCSCTLDVCNTCFFASCVATLAPLDITGNLYCATLLMQNGQNFRDLRTAIGTYVRQKLEVVFAKPSPHHRRRKAGIVSMLAHTDEDTRLWDLILDGDDHQEWLSRRGFSSNPDLRQKQAPNKVYRRGALASGIKRRRERRGPLRKRRRGRRQRANRITNT